MRTLSVDSTVLTTEQVNSIFRDLEEQATEGLLTAGVRRGQIRFRRFFDASYVGQVHELMVPAHEGVLERTDELVRRFHEAPDRFYTYRIESNPVQFYHWRVRAIGAIDRMTRVEQRYAGEDSSHAAKVSRHAYFDELRGFVETPVYDGNRLEHGNTVVGPAIVEDATTSVVVFPRHRLVVNRFGDYAYTIE